MTQRTPRNDAALADTTLAPRTYRAELLAEKCECYRAEMRDERSTAAERRAARAKLAALRLAMARAALAGGYTTVDLATVAMTLAE